MLSPTKHQEHVIKHVLGCRILGVLRRPGHIHFLLDIPFLWSIDADGAMALVQDEEAVGEFDEAPEYIAELVADIRQLHDDDAEGLRHFAPPETETGMIEDVELFENETDGRCAEVHILGDEGTLTVRLAGL